MRVNETERKILKMICDGKTNQEISEESGLKRGSIEKTLTRLYAKIGARNKPHAAAISVMRDYNFNLLERYSGVPMKIFQQPKKRKRMIRQHFELR